MKGTLSKMRTSLTDDGAAQYELITGEQSINLQALIGQPLKLTYTGNIYCKSCGKKTKKSYSQGHCYVCMQKLASCDLCIMKPETCHFEAGTCREPQWGQDNCMIPHYVYRSNTSGIKVGITRHTQTPTRWIDQGATQALIIAQAKTRHISGLLEVALAQHVADKTHWQAMLKGNADDADLNDIAQSLLAKVQEDIKVILATYGDDALTFENHEIVSINYPVTHFPTKVKSFNFDKHPEVEGVLQGIKGQYLLLDTGVINIRKFGSYEVTVTPSHYY